MKLSTKGRYGLRALIDLAQHGGEGPVSITSIAERQEISERYLEQLMSKLKKAGIILLSTLLFALCSGLLYITKMAGSINITRPRMNRSWPPP